MIKLAVLFTVSLATLTSLIATDNCKKGLKYCSYNLVNKENYYNEIVAELQKNGQSVDPQHISQSTFQCRFNSQIMFDVYCHKGCHNSDNNHSDWCS